MKVDLTKCTEIVPGVFKKTNKTFYVKDTATGKIVSCNKEKIDKLVAKYGSIEKVGKEFTAKKPAKKSIAKNLIRSSPQSIEAVLINDNGEKVATFTSAPVNQEGSNVLYTFEDAKFKHGFIFVLKLNEKLFHPDTKSFKEVKVKLFNGHTEETYDAVYDKEMDYYCILDCDAAIQLLSVHIEH
jgi:hypothetical protein